MRITVDLRPDEKDALFTLSQRERRHPRQQAAILLRRALEERGLLEPEDRVQQMRRLADAARA